MNTFRIHRNNNDHKASNRSEEIFFQKPSIEFFSTFRNCVERCFFCLLMVNTHVCFIEKKKIRHRFENDIRICKSYQLFQLSHSKLNH